MEKIDYIYRVEDKEGKGCYRNQESKYDRILSQIDYAGYDSYRPSPLHDTGIDRRPDEDELCGFKTLDQVLSWFPLDILERLFVFGFTISKYKAIITAEGEKQVLFKRLSTTVEIEVISLSNASK